jgi:hypothetical protein
MTINGIAGNIESTINSSGSVIKRCNINFLPSLGVHTETVNHSGSIMTILCKEHPCINCEDYTTLMALEMVLYHAINALDYRLVRPYTATQPEGVWLQYQGAVAAWNRNAFATSYVSYINAERETLGVQLGWCNPVCTAGGFLAYADVVPNPVSSGGSAGWSGPQFDAYRIFYLRSLLSTNNSYDNNETPRSNGPISFIVKHTSGGSLLYMGPGGTDSLKTTLVTNIAAYTNSSDLNLASAVVVSTAQELTSGAGITSGATVASNSAISGGVVTSGGSQYIYRGGRTITFWGTFGDSTDSQTVNPDDYLPAVATKWQLGICAPPGAIGGLGYAVQGFSLGFAPDVPADNAFIISEEMMDRYNVAIHWYDTHSSGETFGPINEGPKEFKVFGLLPANEDA